jgi:hypothetical protein
MSEYSEQLKILHEALEFERNKYELKMADLESRLAKAKEAVR